MWHISVKGEQEFKGGQEDWEQAARAAAACPAFRPDDEDEMVAEETVSCYNCQFRRWTVKSFICCQSVSKKRQTV